MVNSVNSMRKGEDIRLFFAVLLGEQLREPAADVQNSIDLAGAKIKWVEPENLHFTVKFLGEVPAGIVPELAGVGKQVAGRHKAFEILIGGAGAFPRVEDARAVWLGCRSGAEPLAALANDLDRALADARTAPPEKRPFRAHLTIGRNKGQQRVRELAEAIRENSDARIGTMKVSQFVLMRSELAPAGPVYSIVEKFPLSGQ